ncbi:MAG: hypothetical protein CMO26_01525 [Thiotrichales bacterium]|nr:hypothetical protein [Thiotrichales bacterium]
MPWYQFKSVNQAGDLIEGQMEASTQTAVVEALRAKGQTTIRADPVEQASQTRQAWTWPQWPSTSVSHAQLSDFTVELATLLQARVPLDQALALIERISAKGPLLSLIQAIRNDVRGGSPFSDALARHPRVFSTVYINLVHAGETAGALDLALEKLAELAERSRELKDALMSALLYPLILTIVAIASLVVILTFVTPRFSAMFEDAGIALPWSTQLVMSIGELLTNYGWLLPVAVVATWLITRAPQVRLQLSQAADRLLIAAPVIGPLTARYEMTRFCRTLGNLLRGGVAVVDAIEISRGTVSNCVIATALEAVPAMVRDGGSVSTALNTSTKLPRLAGELAAIGEASGTLSDMLIKVADIYERDVRTVVQRSVKVLEPLLIVSLAVIVGAVIFSVLSAVLKIHEIPI